MCSVGCLISKRGSIKLNFGVHDDDVMEDNDDDYNDDSDSEGMWMMTLGVRDWWLLDV